MATSAKVVLNQWAIMVYFPPDQELDGCAIAVGLGSSPGPDWLKDVVPVLGLRLKVHNALRTWLSTSQVSWFAGLCRFAVSFDNSFISRHNQNNLPSLLLLVPTLASVRTTVTLAHCPHLVKLVTCKALLVQRYDKSI